MQDYNNDEEEEECRVCRGPAEEEYVLQCLLKSLGLYTPNLTRCHSQPLFHPCQCSGSIGLVHQDCLQQWLAVQRTQRCELCGVHYQFEPQYAPHAPITLSWHSVIWGLVRQSLTTWMPLGGRVALAAALWLIVAPLATAYLYTGWMVRPWAVFERSWSSQDWAGGLIVCIFIIISFLSLMGLADFLRVEWQQRGLVQPQQQQPVAQAPVLEEQIDDALWQQVQAQVFARPRGLRHHRRNGGGGGSSMDGEDLESDGLWLHGDEDESSSSEEDLVDEVRAPPLPPLPPAPPQQQAPNPRVAQPGVDFDDGGGDVDINIALDEVLGVRGPLTAVIRNLFWLLSFNAVYIGFFCFIPRTVGTAVSHFLWNATTNPNITLASLENQSLAVSLVLQAIDSESTTHDAMFRLHDLMAASLGYLIFALSFAFAQFLWKTFQRIGIVQRRTGEEIDAAVQLADEQPGVALNIAIGVALECMMAVNKVGILLFLKMLVLPIFLGCCLDASISSLFGHAPHVHMIAYAGSDLFSFVLLHWVLGITFMLLVTVSVLQLREVVHPDLLSHVIRPQEPQPDLLGNLMQETVATHSKRLVVSLVTYGILWILHIYVPARLFAATGIHHYLFPETFKLAYIFPSHVQTPLELLAFHLCMLAMLERYKNGIGEMQHVWLKCLTRLLGLRECLLPQTVDSFEYVGSRLVFDDDSCVDAFWFELGRESTRRKRLESLRNALDSFEPVAGVDSLIAGTVSASGAKVLMEGNEYIRLPSVLPGKRLRSTSKLMPTRIGRFQLCHEALEGESYIHLYMERSGEPIPRPPEGWDDLGVEPPDVQGRWAYGKERKSKVEESVASRRPFFSAGQSRWQKNWVWLKIFVLLGLSWTATTLLLFILAMVPISVGRLVFGMLQVPDHWQHHPAAFALGFLLSFYGGHVLLRTLNESAFPAWQRVTMWLSRFRFPPLSKFLLLLYTFLFAFVAAPLEVGYLYRLVCIDSTSWRSVAAATENWTVTWLSGALILLSFSFLVEKAVFSRQFWTFVLFGNPMQDHGNSIWQGPDGRIAVFWKTLGEAFARWDWSVLDPEKLLYGVAMPLVFHLSFSVLTVAHSFLFMWLHLFTNFRVSDTIVVRTILGVVLVSSLTRAWRSELRGWFDAAHKAARDDLYLIGEVLMNYGESS